MQTVHLTLPRRLELRWLMRIFYTPEHMTSGCLRCLSDFILIVTIIVGVIVGRIARAIMPGNQSMGLIMTTILGIVGALLAVSEQLAQQPQSRDRLRRKGLDHLEARADSRKAAKQ